MIQISLLPHNINEEILFDIFRVYGKILEIRMNRDYYQQVAAIIEYANQISANQAVVECRKLKIQNQYIQVCHCDTEDFEEFRTVNLFINNIPANVKQDQLRIFFEQFGEVQLCKIKKLQFSKVSFSGVLEYKDSKTTINLMKIYLRQPLKVNGNIIIIQPFKEKSQTRESIEISLQNFCRKLTPAESSIPNIQRLIEVVWELMIVEYYLRKNVKLKDCIVKCKLQESPQMLLVFPTLGETIKFMKHADQYQNHSCFQLGNDEIPRLIKKFKMEPYFMQTFQDFLKIQNISDDYFKGNFANFNCRYCFNSISNYDDRLLAIQGINANINQNQLKEYLQQFGIIRHLVFREDRENKTQVCLAFALSSYDANNILNDFENKLQDQSKCLISDLGLKIQRFHFNHKEYDRTITELFMCLYNEIQHHVEREVVVQQVVKAQQTITKENFKTFSSIDQNQNDFTLLSQIDQKYIIQKLVYEEVAKHSHLNLVDQKRIACIIINKFQKLEQILELQKNTEQFVSAIEGAENQIILDLHSDVIKRYPTIEKIMNNFQEFYGLKEDQKINILKFLVIKFIDAQLSCINQSNENMQASKLAKQVMKKQNFKVQDLLCLLEDGNELIKILKLINIQ